MSTPAPVKPVEPKSTKDKVIMTLIIVVAICLFFATFVYLTKGADYLTVWFLWTGFQVLFKGILFLLAVVSDFVFRTDFARSITF
jgi:uncharacterized membrane protein YqhA